MCFIAIIKSHTITIVLYVHYSREATTGRAPGQPMVFTASGRFESAPVVEDMEVAVAAGGDDGDDDDDDDGREDRKRKATDGPV